MSYTQIQVRPRRNVAPDMRARGAWGTGWKTIAYVPPGEPSEPTIESLQSRAPKTLFEYRTQQREQNPPHHLHIPPAVAQLGTVLDLSTQSDAQRTFWESADVGGMRMCTDSDAMQRRAGSAALYLLRTEKRENYAGDWNVIVAERASNPSRLYADGTQIQIHRMAGNIYRATSTDGLIDLQIRATTEADAFKRAETEHAKAYRNRRKRNASEHADAAKTYDDWHDREPAELTEVDNLPDLIGIYIGRATRIGYRSDKWGDRGHFEDYDHDYTEPAYETPEVWADRLDISHAHAIVIVGGNQRITPEGID